MSATVEIEITGDALIGDSFVRGEGASFDAINPATGATLGPVFRDVSTQQVAQACALAEAAFEPYRALDLDARARFLEAIAEEIVALGDTLIERACAESGLPRARIEGERGRTVGQLRMFASVVREGSWLGLRIDPAQPERTPMPRSDLRQMHIPLGPVAVFGASNFPLAFSVAGGDTASALAAGCPVVVKGHPAHPGTSELVGRAVHRAAQRSNVPEGTFSLLTGASNAVGSALVSDPHIAAVGFTGSRRGGLALVELASKRDVPIPVYAEMSAVNPVYLLPAALAARGEAIAKAYVASVAMGSGQFCTNPGLVFAIDGPDLDSFIATAAAATAQTAPTTMLSKAICDAYASGVARLRDNASVELAGVAQTEAAAGQGRATLFATDAARFAADPSLAEEIFGATSLIVRCPDAESLLQLTRDLEGQLTATLQIDDGDHELASALLPILERKVGRILANGFPTGVEVGHAMVHGGPFPSTSDGRSTSVGSLAIQRFLRPVCYQDLPPALLPRTLHDDNGLTVPRRIDGVLKTG